MSYKIIRFYANPKIDNEVIATGLSLEEAQEHCNDPETSSRECEGLEGVLRTSRYGAWFEGYTEE